MKKYEHVPEHLQGPVTLTAYPNDTPNSPRVVLLLGKVESTRKAAGMQLLEEGREADLVADNIPLDGESITAILERAPEHLDTILERLWIEKVLDHHDTPTNARKQEKASPAAQVILAVLDAWEGLSYEQYHKIVQRLHQNPDRLEKYLTLLEDLRADHRRAEQGVAAMRAAELAVALHQ